MLVAVASAEDQDHLYRPGRRVKPRAAVDETTVCLAAVAPAPSKNGKKFCGSDVNPPCDALAVYVRIYYVSIIL